jgi:probable O-glycosylation ligase (exosortase A-associated)
MRDLILAAVVLGVLPFAIRKTWVAVLLWTWFSVMNPHRLAFGFAFDAPFAAIAAGAALISLLVAREKSKLPIYPPVVVLILFIVWMCITTAVAIYPEPSFDELKRSLKIQLMTLIAFAALRERLHIHAFVWVNALSIGFYGLKGGIFTITSGGTNRVWGPAGSYIEGNNEVGLALILAIPLMYYLRLHSSNVWVRRGMLILMFLSASAALGTQSRGALLAIAAMGIVLWVRLPRKFVGTLVMAIATVVLLALMPETWEARMRTIGEYQSDGSAMGRINAWIMAFNLANDRPIGGGFSIITDELFAKYAPDPFDVHAAHSIYFQVLGEHGYFGLALYLLLGYLAFRMAAQVRNLTRGVAEDRWIYDLVGMCQVSLVGFAVGGAFLSLAYFDLPYNVLVIIVCSMRYLRERGTVPAGAAAPAPAPPTAAPPGPATLARPMTGQSS